MGMSTEKIKERRGRPWPRYRISLWNSTSLCWREDPEQYYDATVVLQVARRYTHGMKGCDPTEIRICTQQEDGKKVDTLLPEFEKEQSGGQAEG